MRIIENQTFTSVAVHFDDSFYRKCTFNQCQIIYGGGDFGWADCQFSPDCKITFIGMALRVVEFLKYFHLVKEPAPQTPLPPVVNTSGFIH